MAGLARVSMSLEEELLQQFDRLSAARGYPTRSEAIKALMREALVEQQWETDQHEVAGAITMVYDHHRSGLVKQLMDVQHDSGEAIVSTQHVHLDHHHCLEVVVLRGRAAAIKELLAGLKAVKGVKHSALMMATTGEGVQ